MPPVGQKRRSGKGAANEASSLAPPTASAGNSFSARNPSSRRAIASETVAQPGRNGTGAPTAARASSGVAPGLTRNRAPARDRFVDLVGRNDRARADDGVGNLAGDRPDRRERGRRAQRHLDREKASGRQGLRLSNAVLDARHGQDRDHRRKRHDRSRFAVAGIVRHRSAPDRSRAPRRAPPPRLSTQSPRPRGLHIGSNPPRRAGEDENENFSPWTVSAMAPWSR